MDPSPDASLGPLNEWLAQTTRWGQPAKRTAFYGKSVEVPQIMKKRRHCEPVRISGISLKISFFAASTKFKAP